MPHTIAENLARLTAARDDIAAAIAARGGNVSSSDGLEDFPALIASLPDCGVDTEVFTSFPISINSSEGVLRDYIIYGNSGGVGDACINEISMPHYRESYVNRGISYQSNPDGTVTASGTADSSQSSYDVLMNDISPASLTGKTYTMSADDSVTEGVFIIIYFYNSGGSTVTPTNVQFRFEGETEWRTATSSSVQTRFNNTYQRSVTVKFNDLGNVARCQLQIRAYNSTVLDNFVFKPMFFEGEEFQPFDMWGAYKIPIGGPENGYMVFLPSPLGASGDDADELSYSEQAATYRAGRSEPETVPVDVPAIETLPDFAETVISFGTQIPPGKVSLTFRGWHKHI